MRTDDLISIIAADHRQVDSGWLNRATLCTALVALGITIILVLATLGPRHDLATSWVTGPVITKLAFGASLAAIALTVFQRSLKPGLRPAGLLWLCLLPVGFVGGRALWALIDTPIDDWSALILGRYWLTCIVAVPLYALIPSALLLGLAQRGAPIDGKLTGVSAGLASAGIAVMGYGMHCPDDAAPFVATWNTIAAGSVALSTMLLGSRILRW